MATIECLYCHISKEVPSLRKKYCSLKCAKLHRSQLSKITLVCEHCGKSFERRRRIMSPNNYCCHKCANLAKGSHITRTCPVCGKVLKVHPSLAKEVNYCSKQCLGKSQQKRVICICKHCGKQFERNLQRISIPRGGTFCSRSCTTIYNLANVGKKPTDIEIAIEKLLISMGIVYKSQKPLGKFVCDFYIKSSRLIIECDGIYWHSKPEQIEKDRIKDAWLIAHSYKVLRLNNKEIFGDIEQCRQRIIEAMQRKGTHKQLDLLTFGY